MFVNIMKHEDNCMPQTPRTNSQSTDKMHGRSSSFELNWAYCLILIS